MDWDAENLRYFRQVNIIARTYVSMGCISDDSGETN